jgi:glycosyltransferase involved in cell wall biosynthesis
MYVAGPGGLKNHRVLAPMMASLAQRHPELRCKLTVRREDVDALVSAAIRLDCIDRFDFLGPTPSQTTMALLARAQVSVMPSLLESFGIPYFEALALGVPSVGADVPCAREALGEAGRFAQPDSGESWAECVNEILTDRDLFVNQSLARHHSRPTWSEVAARYLQMLREL